MRFPVLPTDASAAELLSVVEQLLAEQVAMAQTFQQLTSVGLPRLKHPAARRLQRGTTHLWAAGAELARGEPRALSAHGLLGWMRNTRASWEQLLRDLPAEIEAVVTDLDSVPTTGVSARLREAHPPSGGALSVYRRWAPRPLPVDGSVDAFLRTLTHSQLRQTADHTCRQNSGSPASLRRACLSVLEDREGVLDQLYAAPGAALMLLRQLLSTPEPLPLSHLSSRWGPLLQDAPDHMGSGVGWLQRLGLVYAGIDPTTGGLALALPHTVRAVLQDSILPQQPELPGLELEVSLSDITPRIWRRIRLRGDASLADLHLAIQDAFGWNNLHLFECFRDDPQRTHLGGMPDPDPSDPLLDAPATNAWTRLLTSALRGAGDELVYLYDFGDDWEHRVQLLSVLPQPLRHHRALIAGERAGPPEDCGGPPGHADCVATVLGARHDPELLAWLEDWHPEGFELTHARAAFDL